MHKLNKIFFNKKILIYGLGITGTSSFNYLKKTNSIKVYDDNSSNINLKKLKKYSIKKKQINKSFFDYIIISPGINSKKCSLKKFLKKNKEKICTDLDIFYTNNLKNLTITVTGTNGKSTSVKIISDILKKAGHDVRLVGNIGKSILNENKIKKKTIFVIEASSYQIEYSNFFKSRYSILLNIKPDHIERHGSFNNYLQSKLKLFYNQTKKDYALYNKEDLVIDNSIKKNKLKCKVLDIDPKINKKYINKIKNKYFFNRNNQENLSFIITICNRLRIKKNIIINTINKFQPLKYRQQTIYNSNKLLIINDSKSTSFSSSINLFYYYNNIFWILGGQPKKNDKFDFKNKKNYNVQAYIFGKNKKFFTKQLKNKMKFQVFPTIKKAYEKVLTDIKKFNIKKKKTILFSPSSASFDEFKNFEERGAYFNFLVKSFKGKL